MATPEIFLQNARNYIKTVPKGRLYLYLFLLVAIIGGSIIGISILQKEEYQPLFSGLSTEDASMIVAKLKEQKIPYKLGAGGTAVYVPKERVYEVRLMLASHNALPGGGGVGFELFDRQNYGMTEFLQNVNYKRAIQGELVRTINQMPEVKASRVHIAIPERTVFTERERDVTASVFLKLRPARTLSREQIAGIVHLVAGSIEGLKPENVTVIDSSGKILYKGGDSNSNIALTGQEYELQKNIERKIEESVQSMLDRFLPASKSVTRVSVELNLRKVEKVEEEYIPEKTAKTSERKSKERSVNQTLRPGGVPGASANIARAGARGAQETLTKTGESDREESQVTYEVSKTVRKIVEPYGDIKRISLAIVVDGRYEQVKGKKGEESKYIPRSPKELNEIKNLVAKAVGYDEARGDTIEVINLPFETDTSTEELEAMKREETKDLILNIGRYLLYILILLSILFFVVRPMIDMLKKKRETIAIGKVKDVYIKEGEKEPASVAAAPQPAMVSALKDKAVVRAVIKEWLKESET